MHFILFFSIYPIFGISYEHRVTFIDSTVKLRRCELKQIGCDGTCTPNIDACNDIGSCKDGADEDPELCGNCPDHYFQCDDNVCHPAKWLCDGERHCSDGTDESTKICLETCSPPYYYKCNNSRCITISRVCDGYDDCGDKSDEGKICKKPLQVSLTGGRDKSSGLAHVKFLGFWGTICGEQFQDKEARVVCRSLGFHGPASAHRLGFMGKGEGRIWLQKLDCKGDENNLNQCKKSPWGFHFCTHETDVGVSCSKPEQFPTIQEMAQCGIAEDFLTAVTYNEPIQTFIEIEDLPMPSCLRPTSSNEGRIIGGHDTKSTKEFPWIAELRIGPFAHSSHYCGGAILTEYFVLTAAHCLSTKQTTDIMVRVGEYDEDTPSYSEDNFEVDKIFVHPDYDANGWVDNDIALIKVKPKAGHGIIFTKEIQPVCLPTNRTRIKPNVIATIAGWGVTEVGSGAEYLRITEVPILRQKVCKNVHTHLLTSNMFCAGDLWGGRDSCSGDSGGPLVVRINGRATVLGVVSWGEGCGHKNKPGVYTRVPNYVSWILEQMKIACD